MTKLGFWAGLLAAALSSASAQVTVEVAQPQDQFLPGEALPVTVRIMNLSGQTLHLGGDSDWLTFSVESREGVVVPKFGDLPVFEPFELPSSKMATKRMDLGPCFPITQVGRYNIIANVRIKEWGHEIASKPKGMDIIEGVSMWQQEFGVPRPPGQTNGSPEIRRYILQQANYVEGQLRLYLRVTDFSGTRPLRVFPIGALISFSRPEHLIDQASDLHVLYQDGPRSFSYTRFSPDGDLLARQTHEYIGTRPRLRVDAEGNISVFGGLRRITSNDVPPPKPVVSLEAPKPLNQD
ncbi:MAG: hypothetical protein ABSH34_06670 [Verrucomicrobiota bacterium]|jgi:hypothetical protein